MAFAIFVGFLILMLVFVILNAKASAKRREQLATWARSNGLNFTPGKDYDMGDRFSHFACLRRGSNRYAHNITSGKVGHRPLIAFDYHYETESHDDKGNSSTTNHHFSAVVVISDFRLKPLFIRPEGFFDKIKEFFGVDDINFESAEFSRKFHVTASDKKWAYDVIHQRTMEFLLSQPMFSIQFDTDCIIAWRDQTFDIPEFQQAIDVVIGILDRLPDYLVRQQRE